MASRKAQASEPEIESEAPAPPELSEDSTEVLNGVFVIKRTSEQTGEISTEVMLNGAIQPTEVQTLLELAVKSWRRQIGLSN
jgi:hypothetical protein